MGHYLFRYKILNIKYIRLGIILRLILPAGCFVIKAFTKSFSMVGLKFIVMRLLVLTADWRKPRND